MSSFIYGDLVFQTKLPFDELCNFAESLRAHNISTMHLKFGGNVSNQYLRSCPLDVACLQYEITDSILQNTANEIIAPSTYCDVAPLNERINSMERFVRSAFMHPGVSALYLNLNVGQYDKDPLLECGVSDFAAKLLHLFLEDPTGGDVRGRLLVTPASSLN